MHLFFTVILPIIGIFSLGYILQKVRAVDIQSVAAVSLYIFLPMLVFTSLYEATYDGGYTLLIVFAFVLLGSIVIINKVFAKIFNWSQSVESAMVLTTGFMNAGNYGLPVIMFALGDRAVPYAIFFMVIQSIIMNVFGVYYASRGSMDFRDAIQSILKMPATYAIIAAFIFQSLAIEIPDSIYSTMSMVGDGAIPLMMVLLGMQLAAIQSFQLNWQVISLAVITRMFLSPLIAFGFILLFDVEPILGSVLLVVSAMPSAATTTMFAIEFDTEPDLVSTITLATTLFSVVSLTVLLYFIA